MLKSLKQLVGVLALGLAAAQSLSSMAQAQSVSGERPAFSRLADRIVPQGNNQEFDGASQGLVEPMHVDEVLPPRRPSPASLAASRARSRTATSDEAWIARPVEATRPSTRRNSLCATDRCPNANMVGIQY